MRPGLANEHGGPPNDVLRGNETLHHSTWRRNLRAIEEKQASFAKNDPAHAALQIERDRVSQELRASCSELALRVEKVGAASLSHHELFTCLEELFLSGPEANVTRSLADEAKRRVRDFFAQRGLPVLTFAFDAKKSHYLQMHVTFDKAAFLEKRGEKFFPQGHVSPEVQGNPHVVFAWNYVNNLVERLFGNPAYTLGEDHGAGEGEGKIVETGREVSAAAQRVMH